MTIEKIIEEAVREHIESEEMEVSKEEFDNAVKGVMYWYNVTICEAISDSLSSATFNKEQITE
ncbi:hypothetical protein HUN92_13670 [Bacillus firmus]|uniref:hypothetical protein n=1 Tax=Cytobacillus firmus TaxID=1399 RepID=UPI001580D93A|nr:hypothetical protein [Cytobacillus firmus]NUH84768.1 hypothetical protein [Cytobacillus firmus]